MNIIIVDDEIQALHTFLDQMLVKSSIDFHYKFFIAEEKPILDYSKDNQVEAAFLDVNMGVFSGFDLAMKLIEINPHIRIIFVTGYNINKEDIPPNIVNNTFGIIHKPYSYLDIEEAIRSIANLQSKLKIEMFPHFDAFINGELVTFSSNNAKELFAYIIANNGKSVTMEDAITALWPDKEIEKAKISYRDAVWRLRQTLKEINFECVSFNRALLVLNKDNIECSYFDYLEGKKKYHNEEFLTNYEWSLPFETMLKNKAK